MIANENSDGPRVSRVSDSMFIVCKNTTLDMLDFVDGWNWGKKDREGRVLSEYFDDNYADKEGDNGGKKMTKNARTWRRKNFGKNMKN